MENNEPITKNTNNFPINVVEQKETKNIYQSKRIINQKLNKINNEEKLISNQKQEIQEEKKEEILKKDETYNKDDFTKEKEEKEEKKEEEEKLLNNRDILNKNNENIDTNYKSSGNNIFINIENKTIKELKSTFNDIIKNEFEYPDKLPLIRNGSYLTELPSEAYNKKKDKNYKANKYKESSKVIKYLKEKELSLNKEITNIKDKKDKLMNVSFNNIGLSDIEKNRNNFEKKKLQTIENNLMEKLNEVKFQINGIIQRERILKNSKSILIQNFIKRYENEELFDIKKYMRQKKKTQINLNKENIKALEEKLDLIEEKKPKEKTEAEIKEEKRKEKIKEEVLKLEKHPSKKNYLFFKMANSFEEKEKLFYKKLRPIKKVDILDKEDLKQFNEKIRQKQKENQDKAYSEKIKLKKEWYSNSLLLPKYQASIMKKVKEKEYEKKLEEEKEKDDKKRNYESKKNLIIPLPKISDKLRKENLKQYFSLNDLHGRDRVQYIKAEISQINNLRNGFDFDNKRYKKSKILNKHKVNNKIFKEIKSNTLNKNENKNQNTIKLHNYLEQSKKNSNKIIVWDKYLNEEDYKVPNIKNIKGQIEGLDYNAEMKKEILRINGGLFNNQKLGNQLGNLLINSINGKISVIKAMNNSN